MIIAIDHGNAEIKTVHDRFVSGYKSFVERPAMAADAIRYNDAYYALSGARLNYRFDKTINDDYYILTLFAIAKEMVLAGVDKADIQLAVGLPPRHHGKLKDRFAAYLVREKRPVQFWYNDRTLDFSVTGCWVFPQAYGAMISMANDDPAIKAMQNYVLIDIGGYTVDVIIFRNRQIVMDKVYSLPHGIIKLLNMVSEELEANTGTAPDEAMIENVIAGRDNDLPSSEKSYIKKATAKYVDDMLTAIEYENGVNIHRAPAFFTGGGAILIKDFLPRDENMRVIEDPLANVKGFDISARVRASRDE